MGIGIIPSGAGQKGYADVVAHGIHKDEKIILNPFRSDPPHIDLLKAWAYRK